MPVAFLKNIFTAPVFENEEQNHQAYLLHVILWGLICIPVPYFLYVLLFTPHDSIRALLQAGIGEVINFFLLFLLRRGRVHLAAWMQVASFWLFFTISAMTEAGVSGESYLLGYPLVIIIAGLLLGRGVAFGVTAASLLAGLWMVYAANQGILNSSLITTPLTTWILSAILFPMGAVLQYLSSRTVKNALERARLSEEKYKLISRVSSDYTFESEVDQQGNANLLWVAGAFEKMTGYSFEEYVASGGWLAHVHPDDLAKDAEDMNFLLRNQGVINSEIRTFTKNGEIRWERIFAHPVWSKEEDRLTNIIGAVQDVTVQKQAEELLKEAFLQQTAILNNIPDMAWLKDLDSRYIAVNEQFAKTCGLRAEDIIGKTDHDIWQKNYADDYRQDDLEVIGSGQRRTVEELQTNDTGREYWVETTKTPIRNSLGEVIGTTGIAREITQRKQAEEMEQRRRIMLEKVIELGKLVTEPGDLLATLKKIWHGIHDHLGYDRVSVFLYNPERNSMDGSIGTDKNGQMVYEWDDSFPINEDPIFSYILKKPDGMYFTHNFDIENNIEEGDEMYGVKEYAAVTARTGDNPVAVICVDQCITQRPITPEQLEALRLFGGYAGLAIENARLNKMIQRELSQKKDFIEELESKNAELERFTYTVSHDLKSPLVTIRGFLGYLERDAQEGKFDKFRQDIKRIEAAVAKMQNLLTDLLELSRIGRLINTPVQLPFEEIVKETLELVHGQLQAKNILIEFHNHNASITCDRVRIVEVMQNLVDNAVKFMGNQAEPKIEIGSFNNDKNKAVFYVKDNGIGIAPKFHGQIFGLFDKLTADSDGTGIGLALVKRIIEVHGGRIWVESQLGRGTTFYFTLS